MIVLDILHNIFEILPELILGAGPFCVFKGMGTGKDSGKLLFKKIYTDTGVNITETSSILDFSVSGGGPPPDPIDTCEIAYGTGTGITSSVWFVDGVINTCGLFGARIISTYGSNNQNATTDCGSLVIGGYQNKLLDPYSENSLIVGGRLNTFYNFCGPSVTSKQSVILGGYCGCMKTYFKESENNFISSHKSYMYGGSNNFLSGAKSQFCKNNYASSLMATDKFSCIVDSSRSQIIQGGEVYKGKGSSIQNGYKNINKEGLYNSIQNGNLNKIYSRTGVSLYINPYTYFSSIVNGANNCIISGRYNTILTGNNNRIVSGYYNPVGLPWYHQWPVHYSVILTGSQNLITIGPNSAILNGCKNEIFVSDFSSPFSPNGINCSSNNVILSGKNNKINWGSNNVSLYRDDGSINRSFRSKLSTSDFNSFNADGATASNNNVIAGGCLNKVSNSVILLGVSENSSKILGSFSTSTFDTSSSNILRGVGTIQGNCDHNNNVLLNFTACDSQIKYANRSTIIGGNLSCIIANGTGSVTSGVILNSFDSKIVAADGCCIVDSVIISGTASGLSHSYRSAIISSFQSRIEGGSLNTIINSSNSIIGKTDPKQDPRCVSCMVSIISSNNFCHCVPGAGMGSSLNSVIIGLTGGCVRDLSCFTVLDNLHILGTVSWSNSDGTGKVDGVCFCQLNFTSINQIVVCNGIVTSIT